MRGVQNPIGVKVSDKMEPAKLVSLIAALNPDNVPGRLAVIVRMGAAKLREMFPAMVEAVDAAGQVRGGGLGGGAVLRLSVWLSV
jgi:3-deoxy-7-phosphoheptulonate synthase